MYNVVRSARLRQATRWLIPFAAPSQILGLSIGCDQCFDYVHADCGAVRAVCAVIFERLLAKYLTISMLVV